MSTIATKLFHSLNDAAVAQRQPEARTMVVFNPRDPEEARKADSNIFSLFMVGTKEEIESRITLWRAGCADLTGFRGRYSRQQVTVSHRDALNTVARVF